MKKLLPKLVVSLALATFAFAENGLSVSIATKMNLLSIDDLSNAEDKTLFDNNMFDDDTAINIEYDNDCFEAGIEILPAFLFCDEDFAFSNTPAVSNVVSSIFAGVKFGTVVKLRCGLFENRTEDFVDTIKVNDFIDELELGFVLADFSNEESDLIDSPLMLDLYFDALTLQFAANKEGGQARFILSQDLFDLSVNYKFRIVEVNENTASAFFKLNAIEVLPILVGYSMFTDGENFVNAIDLRLQKDFEVVGVGLHNNLTILEDALVLYNGLGITVPFLEKFAACVEVNNYANLTDSNGLLTVYPYVKYDVSENASVSLGVQIDNTYGDDSVTSLRVPLKMEVSF